MCALICIRLGKTDQKIFGHSAILNVVRIPLERMEMDREKVPTFATSKGEETEGQSSPDKKIKVFKVKEQLGLNLSSATYQKQWYQLKGALDQGGRMEIIRSGQILNIFEGRTRRIC